MNTPLYDSLTNIIKENTLRMHMPGHKGKPVFYPFDDIFPYDFTETDQTGNLYEEEGAIREAEILSAKYYGSDDCHFLTGGSTQGIHAMLGAICGDGGEVLLDRSCHKSVASACALFDLKPYFVYPETIEPYGFGGNLSLQQIEKQLKAHENIKAMLVVSPNYYGVIQDIKGLSELCGKYNVKLLVDSAHGAHFPAVNVKSPVQMGADIAVLSGHKTLPVMGQGAYLIMNKTIDAKELRRFESMVCTSSPSYPIMLSLDLARNWLENTDLYLEVAKQTANIREFINEKTAFTALTESEDLLLDPCRLTVCTAKTGISGHQIHERLQKEFNIVCEMADDRNIVLILTGMDTENDFENIKNALLACSNGLFGDKTPDKLSIPTEIIRRISVRKAWFCKYKTINIKDAVGKICARPITPYPPGIPIVFSGEEITAKHVEFLTKRCYNTVSEVLICAENEENLYE